MTTDSDAFLAALRLSDSFLPVGGYTASYGLEQYLNEDEIETADDLEALLEAYLRRIVGPCETVAVANAHAASAAADFERVCAVDERLHAVTMPREFRDSSTKAGRKLAELLLENDRDRHPGAGSKSAQSDTTGSEIADADRFRGKFVDAIRTESTPGNYPVVFGVVAQRQGISVLEACLSQAYSFVTGLLGAAQRLGRFGHTEIQDVLESLRPTIAAVCEQYVDADIDAMASFAPLAEIMGMRHERAGRRLFMS
ncbi:urease accessory protein UreF [Halobacteria archaeon AArc-dxtr1]|nr:urease accessory protein UreF [Halobacteria archaeon AArc-dxtr1]